MWGATFPPTLWAFPLSHFNPRTPCGVRPERLSPLAKSRNFNPRTPCGVRPPAFFFTGFPFHFNPRTPCGVRLLSLGTRPGYTAYFNPRTPCGVRLFCLVGSHHGIDISIHAPRVGCDVFFPLIRLGSPRFQSTHPVWGATRGGRQRCQGGKDFNPRTPCGVRRQSGPAGRRVPRISIHAPRVGCDP